MSLQRRLNTAAKRQELREALADALFGRPVDDVENVITAIDAYVKAVVKQQLAKYQRKSAE